MRSPHLPPRKKILIGYHAPRALASAGPHFTAYPLQQLSLWREYVHLPMPERSIHEMFLVGVGAITFPAATCDGGDDLLGKVVVPPVEHDVLPQAQGRGNGGMQIDTPLQFRK